MKRLFITLLIPFLMVSTLLFAANPTPEQKSDAKPAAPSFSGNAVMKFEKTVVDFGDAEAGKTVDVEFKFENAGKETLIINNISTSCGCTAVKSEKSEYKPGEKGTLPVKFNTQGYTGNVSKSITVTINNKENPYVRLELKGNVKVTQFATLEMAKDADRIDFQNAKVGQTYTNKIKVKNSGSVPLRFIEVTSNPEVYILFSKKELAPKEETELKVVFTPMQAGPFNTFLKLYTNDYNRRMTIIKVSSSVK